MRLSSATASFIALVFQNTSMVIFLKMTFREGAESYSASTVVLSTEVVKLLFCTCVVIVRGNVDIFILVKQIGHHSLLLLPSLLYVIQNNLLFYGAERLPSLTYILCSQLKILTTAAMSRLILGTKLNNLQHLCLVVLVTGIVLVQYEGENDNSISDAKKNSFFGCLAIILASWTSGAAGVTLEKIFKTPASNDLQVAHTVWTRNIQLSLISLPFAAFGVLCNSYEVVFSGNFFHGYDRFVWIVVFLQAFGGIIIAFVMKFASNIMKNCAIALSICCCAAYSVLIRELELKLTLVTGVLLVCASVAGYSVFSPRHAQVEVQKSAHAARPAGAV